MDPILLLIALTAAATVSLLASRVFDRAALRERVVSDRITPDAGLSFGPGSVLRRDRLGRFPMVDLLPVSARARENMALHLARAGLSWRVGEYVALRIGLTAALCFVGLAVLSRFGVDATVFRVPAALGFAALGWLLPRAFVARRSRKRLERIEKQLPDALTAMAKSLRAGSGLLQALAYAADETPAPLGTELQGVLRDLQLGADPELVFSSFTRRVGSADLDIAVTAIVIQRSAGGNLAEILAKVTNTIRERAKLIGEVKVLTSRQRLTSNLLAGLPVLVSIAFIMISPKLGNLLISTTPGQIALAAGIALELFGIFLIRRLGAIEV
jgi:tight adherence protein B